MNFNSRLLALTSLLFITAPAFAEKTPEADRPPPAIPTNVHAAPKTFTSGPNVIVEWYEPLEECTTQQMCIQGQLLNSGNKPALKVKIKVELGGSTLIKPRTTVYPKVEFEQMMPGDRQEFSFKLDRRIPYRDNGKDKSIEVGRYNFKIVPMWQNPPPSTKPAPPMKMATPTPTPAPLVKPAPALKPTTKPTPKPTPKPQKK